MGFRFTVLTVLVLGAHSVWGASKVRQLDTKWILDTLHDNNITTIEGLLGKFDKPQLARHLLIYDSDDSLQFASPLSPRVVVYNYDADFIMAFNGEPGSQGYDELEIIKFDHDTWTFHPELISFDPKGLTQPKHNPKPTVCTDCHQKEFRPNWEPYFNWPGLYGSEDDNVNAGYDHPGNVLASGPEFENYKKFVEKKEMQIKEEKGRYRFLPEHPKFRRNEDFNQRVTCLNSKRILRKFANHPLAAKIMTAYGGVGAGEFDLFRLPDELLANASPTSLVDYSRKTEEVLEKARTARVKRLQKATGDKPQGRVRELLEEKVASYNVTYDLPLVTSWRYVFEQVLQIPFRPYSTSRRFDYNMNLGSALDIHNLLKKHEKNKDGTLTLNTKSRGGARPEDDDYEYKCPSNPSNYYRD